MIKNCPLLQRYVCVIKLLQRGIWLALHSRGYYELQVGLPDSWRWAVFDFVESYYDRFHDIIIRELDSLRSVWKPCEGSQQRHGAFAASKVRASCNSGIHCVDGRNTYACHTPIKRDWCGDVPASSGTLFWIILS